MNTHPIPMNTSRLTLSSPVVFAMTVFCLLLVPVPAVGQATSQNTTAQSFSPSHAKTGKLSVQQLTSRAGIVAIGTVHRIQSEWNRERSRIFSRITITVNEYLKGSQQSRMVTLLQPGGEVESVGEVYSEMAQFRTDEEVMVFAAPDNKGNLRVVGGNQGKFSVATEPSTGRKILSSGSTLEDFKSEVKKSLNTKND